MTALRLRSLLSVLSLLFAACGSRAPLEWPAVLADVRAKHPTVTQLAIDELVRELATTKPVLLDARTQEEFATSHLPGAELAPDLDAALDVLARSPNAPVVVYCSVGLRSSALAEELVRHGYGATQNLEGGIFAWANAGHALVTADGATVKVHPFDARWGALLAPEHRTE